MGRNQAIGTMDNPDLKSQVHDKNLFTDGNNQHEWRRDRDSRDPDPEHL
jgi:hypothetical protein